jgi:MFS family permease
VGTYISFGVFFNPLMDEFGWSRAAIAGAASAAFFSMGFFGVMIGRLNDIFGPRRLMSVAALLLGLGCVLMGRLTTLWELYLYFGIIFGSGRCLHTCAHGAMAAPRPERIRREYHAGNR